jgi:nucleoside-diphosphate-sugar epimerase
MGKTEKAIRSLVTGSCGFIGSHVVEVLAENGHEVVAADHPSAWVGEDNVKAAKYPGLVRNLARETYSIDLGDPGTLDALPKDFDYVFHVASVFNYTATYDLLHRVNVRGTEALVDRLGGSKRLKRWLQVGAGGVYGLPSQRKVAEFTEDLAPLPGNNYLRSKWEQEYFIMEKGRLEGLPYSIIRPTTVYGPRGGYGARQLFMSLIGGPVVALPANINGHAPFIHVRDVARAALFLAQSNVARNEVYNVTDSSDMTTVDYAEALAKLVNKPFVILPPVPLKPLLKALDPVLRLQLDLFRRFGKGTAPVEPDLLAYMTEDFRFSNAKLVATGFQFEYPDARMAFQDTLNWYFTHTR